MIYPLDRMDPGSWGVMPLVINRVAMFCRKHETDTDPETLVQRVIEHFVVPTPRQSMRAWVAEQNGEIIGHCLVTVDTWCDKVIATIVQYESDVVLDRAGVRRAFDEIAEWARSKGARTLRILALHKDERGHARARLFQRLYGFHPMHIVLDKAL